jgi:exonuclease SbcC
MAGRKREPSLLDLLARASQAEETEPQQEETVDRDLPAQRESAVAPATVRSTVPALRLQALQIENLWAYQHAELAFEEGVTVVAGPNGSGKSSLLESTFFALYGSRAGPVMERALSDVLRLGADAGRVELSFSYGNERYTVQMGLRRRGDQVISDKESCRMVRSDGAEWVGVENVAGEIEKLFNMNRDDFTNCLYVRQGEIDRLIRAGEEERRRMIDRLMRLELLDTYARRAKDGARRAANRRQDVFENQALQQRREIQILEAERLAEEQLKLQRALQKVQGDIEAVEGKIVEAEKIWLGFQEKLKRFDETSREMSEAAQELEHKREQLAQQEKRREQLARSHGELRARYEEFSAKLGRELETLGLDKGVVIKSLNGATDAFEEVALVPGALAESRGRVGELQRLLQERRDALTADWEERQAEKESLLKENVRLKTEAENLQRELAKTDELLAAGRCPTCHQPVSQGTFAQTRQHIEKHLAEMAEALAACEKKLAQLDAEIVRLKKEGGEQLKTLDREVQQLEARRTQLEALKETCLTLLKLKEQGLERKEALRALYEGIETLKNDQVRLEGRTRELQGKLGDHEQLVKQSQEAQALAAQFKSQRAEFQHEQEVLQNRRGAIANRLEHLETLKREETHTSEALARVRSLQDELEALSGFYGTLKRDMCRENITALNVYFNEFFRTMDPGASYRGVTMTDEYEIWVDLVEGGRISPALLSGGERALINIALRAAIHQVLSQAVARLPLILDEPTVYLDRERIQRLQFLLEALGRRVGQVIVVSHEVGLVEGADHEYRTTKGPDNLSSIEKVR